MRDLRFGLGALLLFGSAVAAWAQSFNCDLDVGSGNELIGNGAPSAQFGAAAQQPGVWNRLDAAGPTTPTALYDLSGNLTQSSVVETRQSGQSYGGFNFSGISGDYRLLMADYAFVGSPIQYHFSGFASGHYKIYTYSGDVYGENATLTVSVPNSTTSPQSIVGPIPSGNQFILGVTHSIHDLDLVDGTFEVDLSGNGPPNPSVSGFQIVLTPEPTSLLFFGCASAASFLRRRKRMS